MAGAKRTLTMVVALMLTGWVGVSLAQEKDKPQAPGAGQEGQGGRDRERNMDRFRQEMSNRMKESLGATDEEWKAIQPKLEKVMNVSRQARGGGMGGMFGRRGGGDQTPETPTAAASQELRKALENKETPPAEIAKKIAALREAREKAKAELTSAQKELREILTQRQEATLIMYGLLD